MSLSTTQLTTGTDKNEPKRISIVKGRSLKKLTPLVLIKISSDIEYLDQMRAMLARFKYISTVDSFLDDTGYPIHQEDEPTIKWEDALVSNLDHLESSLSNNSDGAKIISSDDIEAFDGRLKGLAILTRQIDPSSDPLPQSQQSLKPAASDEKSQKLPGPTIPEKAMASEKQVVNAKTLNKGEIDGVFEINNVFGGISFVGPIAACSQIFEPPRELSNLIWVCDDSTLQIQSFESSTQLSMFKEGAVGVDIGVTIKGVTLGAGMESKDKYEHIVKEGYHWVSGAYRYPRAVIRLPIATMRPTTKFKNELAAAFSATSVPDLKKRRIADFLSQYGQAVASEIYLGGHLHTTLLEQKSEESTEKSAEKSIRAGLSFPFGLDLSGKYSSSTGSSQEQQMKSSDLVIEAVGGDTILASSGLELWARSVTPHTNWRITQRAGIKLLIDIPSLVNETRRKEVWDLFGLKQVEEDLAKAIEAKVKADTDAAAAAAEAKAKADAAAKEGAEKK